MESKYLKDKDPWMVAEDIPDCDIFFFQVPLSHYTNDRSFKFIKLYKKALVIYRKFHMGFYFAEKDSFLVGESILQALIRRPNFGREVNRQIVRWSDRLIKFAQTLNKLSLDKYSNQELWALYEAHDILHTKLYTYGWLPVAVDMFHNNFTNKVKQYLYSVCYSKEQAEQAFIVLTTPTRKSIVAKEREEFLRVYKAYQKELEKHRGKNLSVNLRQALTRHSERWGHMGYSFSGTAGIFKSGHYLKELLDLTRDHVSAQVILKNEERQLEKARKKQKAIIKTVGINSQYQRLFEFARDAALTKLYRRHAQLLDIYVLHSLLELT